MRLIIIFADRKNHERPLYRYQMPRSPNVRWWFYVCENALDCAFCSWPSAFWFKVNVTARMHTSPFSLSRHKCLLIIAGFLLKYCHCLGFCLSKYPERTQSNSIIISIRSPVSVKHTLLWNPTHSTERIVYWHWPQVNTPIKNVTVKRMPDTITNTTRRRREKKLLSINKWEQNGSGQKENPFVCVLIVMLLMCFFSLVFVAVVVVVGWNTGIRNVTKNFNRTLNHRFWMNEWVLTVIQQSKLG